MPPRGRDALVALPPSIWYNLLQWSAYFEGSRAEASLDGAFYFFTFLGAVTSNVWSLRTIGVGGPPAAQGKIIPNFSVYLGYFNLSIKGKVNLTPKTPRNYNQGKRAGTYFRSEAHAILIWGNLRCRCSHRPVFGEAVMLVVELLAVGCKFLCSIRAFWSPY
jgi:hypothetical protein